MEGNYTHKKQDESNNESHVNINVQAGKDKVKIICFHQSKIVVAEKNQCDCGGMYIFLNVKRSKWATPVGVSL